MADWRLRVKRSAIAVVAVVLLLGGNAPFAGESEASGNSADDGNYSEAFARLKLLEGVWDEAEYGRQVRYHLTGKGSALIEEFVGDPPMTSVYHMDGDGLRLTHYCNAGNQPRMIAGSYAANALSFDFVDVTNLKAPDAYHTRTLNIDFIDEDHVVLRFTGSKEGREIVTTHTLTRVGAAEGATR